MNISTSGITNYCYEKCAISFNYSTSSSCIVTNEGTSLLFSYDATNTTPVTFDNIQYNVSSINLYAPSLHLFNGSTTTAELVITHNTINGSDLLYICIPVNSTSNNTCPILNTILNEVINTNIDTAGETTNNLVVDNYNLNQIVPYKSYFYYQQNRVNNTNYINNVIVYGLSDAIYINNHVLTGIVSYITPYTEVLFPSEPNLNFNSKGPSTNDIGGDIYINCQPVDSSTEEVEVAFKQIATSTISMKPFMKFLYSLGFNDTSIMILIAMSMIIVIYMILAFRRLYSPNPKTTTSALIASKIEDEDNWTARFIKMLIGSWESKKP